MAAVLQPGIAEDGTEMQETDPADLARPQPDAHADTSNDAENVANTSRD